jgi:hypothetical protein
VSAKVVKCFGSVASGSLTCDVVLHGSRIR